MIHWPFICSGRTIGLSFAVILWPVICSDSLACYLQKFIGFSIAVILWPVTCHLQWIFGLSFVVIVWPVICSDSFKNWKLILVIWWRYEWNNRRTHCMTGIACHTKMCVSVIPFIPSSNDQNQLSFLIINFLLIICSYNYFIRGIYRFLTIFTIPVKRVIIPDFKLADAPTSTGLIKTEINRP